MAETKRYELDDIEYIEEITFETSCTRTEVSLYTVVAFKGEDREFCSCHRPIFDEDGDVAKLEFINKLKDE